MLECIGGLRRHPPLVEHLGLHQLPQAPPQRQLVQGRHRLEQLVGKRPPQDRPQLRHRLALGEPIQPGPQRVLQRGGNGQRGEGAGQRVVLGCFLEPARLQHRLGQLFHKQRHAIGPGHYLPQHLRGQRLAAGHPLHHLLDLRARQPRQGELGQRRTGSPRRHKLRATRQQRQ